MLGDKGVGTSAKQKISTVILSHCTKAIDKKYAISLECSFQTYAELSEELSCEAETFLLWTMYGSPLERSLDVPDSLLTSYDICFNKIQIENNQKYRLVIFEDTCQASEYLSARYESLQRKNEFEISIAKSGGQLLFTTVPILRNILKFKNYIEFACIGYGESLSDAIMFHSKFNSKDTKSNTDYKEVRIWPYDSNRPASRGHHALVKQLRNNYKIALDNCYYLPQNITKLISHTESLS